MSTSFDHAICVLNRPAERELATWRNPPREIWRPGCSYTGRKGCDQEPRYKVSLRYVTGRAGRVTTRRRVLCEEHARQFAEAHGLALPELPARAKLTVLELDAQFGTDNAGELEALSVFQSALRKALGG